ncbi:MAG TPA: M3 family metallopeptidase, partial [Chthoniobacteraceae bacterium]
MTSTSTDPSQEQNGDANPLLAESPLPFQFPQFDRIEDKHFPPAFERAIAEHLAEVESITSNSAVPSFDNTIVALERSGQTLGWVARIFSALNAAHTNPSLQTIEAEIAPQLTAHRDAIYLDGKLFARIQVLHADLKRLELDAESEFLVRRYYKDFVRAGAKLPAEEKTRLKAVNEELASLQTAFQQNVLKEVNAATLFIDDPAELQGLAEDAITAAAAAAEAEGHNGKYALRLLNTSGQPVLSSLENRSLRQRLHEASLARNSSGGPYDNQEIVARIARLRSEHAQLLGYSSHAAFELEDQTALTTEAVNKLLGELAGPAVANAQREAADMQTIVDRSGSSFPLAAWDWDFYSEQVRQERFAFDEEQLKPYFELNRVLQDGVFFAATRLFGITFQERHDLPVYHENVRVFDVIDADGDTLALFLADFFARPSKRGGAWMNSYAEQSMLLARRPVIGNHQNIAKPAPGHPALLTFDEVNTMFHEFGHALHGMFSRVKYPRFSGTDVPRDFVEFPSQINEMWAIWPEVLKNYARHYETDEPMPSE